MTFETDLIAKGFFPKEVQPTFTSQSFAEFASKYGAGALLKLLGKAWWTKATRHNLARPGGFRRQLSVPNPGGYLGIAQVTAAGWQTHIDPLLATVTMGASRPIISNGPRAVEAAEDNVKIEVLRAANRRGARYLLHTDVQNFYPSIYTHSLDWALHGKEIAKAASKTQTETLGKLLDSAFRGAQDGQTIGISIGPDASLIAAECLMARVEQELRKLTPSISGYRYWDDFELAFPSLTAAEAGLAALEEALSNFELSLNPRKTRLIELPEPQWSPGIFDFSSWDLTSGRNQRRQLLGYFDEVFKHISSDRRGTTAAFAVARLRSVTVDPSNWPLVQGNLLQLLVVEPSCARYVAEIVGIAQNAGRSIDGPSIAKATDLLIEKHAPMGQGSEIAWSLWMCVASKISVSTTATELLVGMKDNLVALLTLHARSEGLVKGALETTYWETLMTAEELRGENWLLSYEAKIKGWLPSASQPDHISVDPFFHELSKNAVKFYDPSNLRIQSREVGAMSNGGGGAY